MSFILHPYQAEGVEALRRSLRAGHRRILAVCPVGCHRVGQQILMIDGSTKPVEEVLVGDRLMGPDSKPRTVLRLCRGRDQMFHVVPIRGLPFAVNANHVLTLVRTGDGKSGRGGEVVDVTVQDWLRWSKNAKSTFKLFKVPVDFPGSADLAIDPYFLGVLLGDGSMIRCVGVCKPDLEIRAAVAQAAAAFGLSVVRDGEGTSATYRLVGTKGKANPIADILRNLGLWGCDSATKFIPSVYRTASRRDRLQLLAGLLDTDGHLSEHGVYDFVSKSRQLAEDTAFLARSLGFFVKGRSCKKWDQNGHGGRYYRLHISGHLDQIPCRIPRKQAAPRCQKKDALRSGFSIEALEVEDFFGFTLDGDGRYLLGDFTVTHNSGKTVIFSHILASVVARGGKGLVLVHREELLDQASDKLTRCGVSHGVIKAGRKPQPCWPVQVASVQSLLRRAVPPASLVVIDECFPAGTLVDGKPIERIQVGDVVNSFNHSTDQVEKRRVIQVFRTNPKNLVSVLFGSGRSLVCTASHPIFTAQGYVPAATLRRGDLVVRMNDEAERLRCLRHGIHAPVLELDDDPYLLSTMQGDPEAGPGEKSPTALRGLWKPSRGSVEKCPGIGAEGPSLLLGSVQARGQDADRGAEHDRYQPPVQERNPGTDDKSESDEGCDHKSPHLGGVEGQGLEAAHSWRQRTPGTDSPAASRGRTRLAHGSDLADQGAGSRISDPLQARHSECRAEDSDRSGWGEPQVRQGAGGGRAEIELLDWERVDGVEVHQLGGSLGSRLLCPDGQVYNLEVDGNNNYFANGILVHNCHRALAASYRQLLERLPDATILGFTATPFRTDGRGLGDVFTDLVEIATPSLLAELGILVPPRIFAPSAPDLVGVRTTAGDYNGKDLVLRVDTPKLIGSVAEHWGRIVRGRLAVAFAASIQHSRHLAQALCGVGARAVHVDADTDSDVRKTYLDLLARGEIDVITNVGLFTEGWDLPRLGAVIVARPTQSTGLWIQMCGRGARGHEGKTDYLLVDHAGNVLRHGFPDEDRIHSLDATPRREPASVKTCPRCFLVVPGATTSCPCCGMAFGGGLGGAPDRTPEVVEGELIELRDRPAMPVSPKVLQRQRDYIRWRAEAWIKGWKPGYASHRYQEKYGVWPVKLIAEAWDESRALEVIAELDLRDLRAHVGQRAEA